MNTEHSFVSEESVDHERDNGTFRETFPLGEGFIHIETDRERLCEDLIFEAITRGIPEEEAIAFAKTVEFSGTMSKPLQLFGIIGKVTEDEENGKTHVDLDIPRTVKMVESPSLTEKIALGKLGNIMNIPSDLPEEARIQAVKQLLDTIWVHEREHLLEHMDPERKAETKATKDKIKNILLGTSYANLVAAGMLLLPELPYVDSQEKATIALLGRIIGGSSLLITTGTLYYNAYLCKTEQNAYEVHRINNSNRREHTPFTFDYETS